MPHLVKYSKADGETGNHEVEELHEAIAYVERLRNDEGVDGAKIYRIEEVQFEFRPYYRVELGGASMFTTATPTAAAPTMAGSVPFTSPAPAPMPEPVAAEAEVAEAPVAPAWVPPVETADATDGDPAPELPSVAAAAVLSEIDPRPMVDPWADAPPPPPPPDAEPATSSNGRRGLFGR